MTPEAVILVLILTSLVYSLNKATGQNIPQHILGIDKMKININMFEQREY